MQKGRFCRVQAVGPADDTRPQTPEDSSSMRRHRGVVGKATARPDSCGDRDGTATWKPGNCGMAGWGKDGTGLHLEVRGLFALSVAGVVTYIPQTPERSVDTIQESTSSDKK